MKKYPGIRTIVWVLSVVSLYAVETSHSFLSQHPAHPFSRSMTMITAHFGPTPRRVGIDWPVTLKTSVPISTSQLRRDLSVSPATALNIVHRSPNQYLVKPKHFWPANHHITVSFTRAGQAPIRDLLTTDNGREIRINLTKQTLSLWAHGRMLMEMPTSTGAPPKWSTPTGTFWIYRRVQDDHMRGGNAKQGTVWDVRHVPWAEYFYGGIAIHGAWWNRHIGRPVSHGCVQLSTQTTPNGLVPDRPPNAEIVWKFADLGTPVIISGRTPQNISRPLGYPRSNGWPSDAKSFASLGP